MRQATHMATMHPTMHTAMAMTTAAARSLSAQMAGIIKGSAIPHVSAMAAFTWPAGDGSVGSVDMEASADSAGMEVSADMEASAVDTAEEVGTGDADALFRCGTDGPYGP
jgi:hypothetical protein